MSFLIGICITVLGSVLCFIFFMMLIMNFGITKRNVFLFSNYDLLINYFLRYKIVMLVMLFFFLVMLFIVVAVGSQFALINKNKLVTVEAGFLRIFLSSQNSFSLQFVYLVIVFIAFDVDVLFISRIVYCWNASSIQRLS